MMGMARIQRGKGFRGVLNYALDKGVLIGGNMSGTTSRQLSKEFKAVRNLRRDVEKPVWHESLRLPKGDFLENEKWVEMADDFMTRLGFNPYHPRAYMLHDDEEGQHIHIVASRIDLDSKLYYGQNENLKATKIIRQLELEHGLRIFAPDPDAPPKIRKPPKKPEIEMALRKGESPPRIKLQHLIDELLKQKPTAPEFAQALTKLGVIVRANVASTGRMNGFSFQLDGIDFKGSSLGKGYTFNGLLERGLIYEQIRHSEQLARWRTYGSITDNGGYGPDVRTVGNSHDRLDRSNEGKHGGWTNSSEGDNQSSGKDREISRGDNQSSGLLKPIQTTDPKTDHTRSPDLANIGRESDNGNSNSRNIDSVLLVQSIAGTGADAKIGDLPADHHAKIAAWRRQHEALNSPHYRITLVDRDPVRMKRTEDGRGFTYVLDKKTGADIKTPTQVEDAIAGLRRENARRFDIYITPVDDKHHYILVDDIHQNTAKKLTKMAIDGFKPVLIQYSSADNYQAVIKVQKLDGDHDFTNKIFQHLNSEYGEPGIKGGVVHPFRMAGFANKKPNKAGFTELVRTFPSAICEKTTLLINTLTENYDKDKKEKEESEDKVKKLKATQEHDSRTKANMTAANEAYWNAFNKALGLAKKMNWDIDLSKIDYKATKDLVKQGYKSDLIEQAIIEVSPDLEQRKGDNAINYATRTVQKAIMEVERERSDLENSDNTRPGM
jgi:hypothetical protein